MTKLGLREGHDANDSAITPTPPIAPQVNNILTIRTSEYPSTSFDPYLTVTYTQTTESTTTTTTNAVTYSYDHAGHRVSKTSDSGTTYYPSADYSVEGSTTTVYVTGPSGLVASVENNGTTSTTETIHTDHLGSTSVVTDQSGIMVELLDYHPFGTERISWSSSSADGEAQAQKTYIGEYSDDETGLSYLNARYYDPERGQFLSQDPMFLRLGTGDKIETLALLLDPQSQNSYSYARNNPVSQSDASGESWLTAMQGFGTGFVKGAVIGFALGVTITAAIALAPAATAVVIGAGVVAGVYGAVATVNSVVAINDAYQSGAITADARDYQYGSMAGSITGGLVGGGAGVGVAKGAMGAVEGGTGGLNTLQPGPYAQKSIPTNSASSKFGSEIRNEINGIGTEYGCHTCGATNPGTQSGNWVPDHQPPSAINTNNVQQQLYPQCINCSRSQGGTVSAITKEEARKGFVK